MSLYVTNHQVTEIGGGTAGFKPAEIAPLFREAADIANIYLPQRFRDIYY